MQLFIPLMTVDEIVKCLDRKRLGKQRLEARQLLLLLRSLRSNEKKEYQVTQHQKGGGITKKPKSSTTNKRRVGYASHALVAMYQGYDDFVAYYYNAVLLEWIGRGYKNSMPFEPLSNPLQIRYPSWWWNIDIHKSHQASLLYKFPKHYGKFWSHIEARLGNLWCDSDGQNLRFITPKPTNNKKKH